MEDITLKGVKVIRYNSERTDEIIRLSPPHAGDTWHLPKWWELKANNQLYLDCTVLEVGGNHLVIPTQMQSELRIIVDGTDLSLPLLAQHRAGGPVCPRCLRRSQCDHRLHLPRHRRARSKGGRQGRPCLCGSYASLTLVMVSSAHLVSIARTASAFPMWSALDQ